LDIPLVFTAVHPYQVMSNLGHKLPQLGYRFDGTKSSWPAWSTTTKAILLAQDLLYAIESPPSDDAANDDVDDAKSPNQRALVYSFLLVSISSVPSLYTLVSSVANGDSFANNQVHYKIKSQGVLRVQDG
jgi:hypothetical protein